MIGAVRRYPVRCALLALVMMALVIVMWNAWPFGSLLITMFVIQAVDLARLRMSDSGTAGRKTQRKAH